MAQGTPHDILEYYLKRLEHDTGELFQQHAAFAAAADTLLPERTQELGDAVTSVADALREVSHAARGGTLDKATLENAWEQLYEANERYAPAFKALSDQIDDELMLTGETPEYMDALSASIETIARIDEVMTTGVMDFIEKQLSSQSPEAWEKPLFFKTTHSPSASNISELEGVNFHFNITSDGQALTIERGLSFQRREQKGTAHVITPIRTDSIDLTREDWGDILHSHLERRTMQKNLLPAIIEAAESYAYVKSGTHPFPAELQEQIISYAFSCQCQPHRSPAIRENAEEAAKQFAFTMLPDVLKGIYEEDYSTAAKIWRTSRNFTLFRESPAIEAPAEMSSSRSFVEQLRPPAYQLDAFESAIERIKGEALHLKESTDSYLHEVHVEALPQAGDEDDFFAPDKGYREKLRYIETALTVFGTQMDSLWDSAGQAFALRGARLESLEAQLPKGAERERKKAEVAEVFDESLEKFRSMMELRCDACEQLADMLSEFIEEIDGDYSLDKPEHAAEDIEDIQKSLRKASNQIRRALPDMEHILTSGGRDTPPPGLSFK